MLKKIRYQHKNMQILYISIDYQYTFRGHARKNKDKLYSNGASVFKIMNSVRLYYTHTLAANLRQLLEWSSLVCGVLGKMVSSV